MKNIEWFKKNRAYTVREFKFLDELFNDIILQIESPEKPILSKKQKTYLAILHKQLCNS